MSSLQCKIAFPTNLPNGRNRSFQGNAAPFLSPTLTKKNFNEFFATSPKKFTQRATQNSKSNGYVGVRERMNFLSENKTLSLLAKSKSCPNISPKSNIIQLKESPSDTKFGVGNDLGTNIRRPVFPECAKHNSSPTTKEIIPIPPKLTFNCNTFLKDKISSVNVESVYLGEEDLIGLVTFERKNGHGVSTPQSLFGGVDGSSPITETAKMDGAGEEIKISKDLTWNQENVLSFPNEIIDCCAVSSYLETVVIDLYQDELGKKSAAKLEDVEFFGLTTKDLSSQQQLLLFSHQEIIEPSVNVEPSTKPQKNTNDSACLRSKKSDEDVDRVKNIDLDIKSSGNDQNWKETPRLPINNNSNSVNVDEFEKTLAQNLLPFGGKESFEDSNQSSRNEETTNQKTHSVESIATTPEVSLANPRNSRAVVTQSNNTEPSKLEYLGVDYRPDLPAYFATLKANKTVNSSKKNAGKSNNSKYYRYENPLYQYDKSTSSLPKRATHKAPAIERIVKKAPATNYDIASLFDYYELLDLERETVRFLIDQTAKYAQSLAFSSAKNSFYNPGFTEGKNSGIGGHPRRNKKSPVHSKSSNCYFNISPVANLNNNTLSPPTLNNGELVIPSPVNSTESFFEIDSYGGHCPTSLLTNTVRTTTTTLKSCLARKKVVLPNIVTKYQINAASFVANTPSPPTKSMALSPRYVVKPFANENSLNAPALPDGYDDDSELFLTPPDSPEEFEAAPYPPSANNEINYHKLVTVCGDKPISSGSHSPSSLNLNKEGGANNNGNDGQESICNQHGTVTATVTTKTLVPLQVSSGSRVTDSDTDLSKIGQLTMSEATTSSSADKLRKKDDDVEEEEGTPKILSARSSVTTITTTVKKKRVIFADEAGQSLFSIRVITDFTQLPDISNAEFDAEGTADFPEMAEARAAHANFFKSLKEPSSASKSSKNSPVLNTAVERFDIWNYTAPNVANQEISSTDSTNKKNENVVVPTPATGNPYETSQPCYLYDPVSNMLKKVVSTTTPPAASNSADGNYVNYYSFTQNAPPLSTTRQPDMQQSSSITSLSLTRTPSSSASSLVGNMRPGTVIESTTTQRQNTSAIWVPEFVIPSSLSSPSSTSSFAKKLQERLILLESVDVTSLTNSTDDLPFSASNNNFNVYNVRNTNLQQLHHPGFCLSGKIRAKNVTFEKYVFVRATFDGWNHWRDYPCTFIRQSQQQQLLLPAYLSPYVSDNDMKILYNSDSFVFEIRLPTNTGSNSSSNPNIVSREATVRDTLMSLEFAVCLKCLGNEYWDNNGGKNYKISLKLVTENSFPRSSITKSTTTGSYDIQVTNLQPQTSQSTNNTKSPQSSFR